MGAPEARALEPVVRYLRGETDRALRGRPLAGTCVEADPPRGRHVGFWLHRAPGTGPRPVLFELHGGGFALGDARKGDALRTWLAATFDVHVVGVEYRLAPEHPAPAQLADALATMVAVASGAYAEVDASRCCLMGYSAGALLALACALALGADGAQAREALGWHAPAELAAALDARPLAVAGQVLHYPFLDAATPLPADERAVDVPRALAEAFATWYVGPGDARAPLVSPVFAPLDALAGLPPTVLAPVEGDPLLGCARRLFDRMRTAGAPATWRPVSGMYHGYIEDAADVRTYLATTMEATVAARPRDYVAAAAEQVRACLELVLGPAVRELPFPGER